jgi:hypothetical protein
MVVACGNLVATMAIAGNVKADKPSAWFGSMILNVFTEGSGGKDGSARYPSRQCHVVSFRDG